MPGIEEVKQRIEELTRAIHALAEASSGTDTAVTQFVSVYNQLIRATEGQSLAASADALGKMGFALNQLGVKSTPEVRALKDELGRLIQQLEQLKALSAQGIDRPLFERRRGTGGPDQGLERPTNLASINREQERLLNLEKERRRQASFISSEKERFGIGSSARGAETQAVAAETQKVLSAEEQLNAQLQREFLLRQQQLPPLTKEVQEEANVANRIFNVNKGLTAEVQLREQILQKSKAVKNQEREGRVPGTTTGDPLGLDIKQQEKITGTPTAEVVKGFEQVFTAAGAASNATKNFNERLKNLEVRDGRVTSATKELSTGITRLNVEMGKVGGITQRATIALDRHGNVLRDAGTRYRTFTGSIVRNLAKVAEWTIAITLTYAPIRALNSLVTSMIELQTELTESLITVGEAQGDVSEIFEAAQAVADETASSVKGVIDGYALAFAATSDVADESQRAVATQTLLRDSMILSKLAGIEQAQALDTLVGALRQTGRSYDEAITLIDSFVAVARNANVSVNTLASVFSIAGAAAQDAGIGFNELNALAATLAEATKLSADETGNAIRGFISGFQSAKSESVLGRFGIAVRNASGDVRDFTQVFGQLAKLSQEGVLDDEQLREITNAIGGGFRRGAQLTAVFKEYTRFLQLTAVSSNAAGEAQAALALKLSTVDSAMTRLNNAFQSFAQALGQEGGMLDGMTQVLNLLTSVVETLGTLTEALGPATTALIGLGAAAAFAQTGTGAGLLARASGAAGRIAGDIGAAASLGPRGITALADGGLNFGPRAGLGARGLLTGGMSGLGATALGLGVPAITTGFALAEGDTEQAGGALAGALVGGIIGSATLIGAPVGAAIGSIAGSALVETLRIEGGFTDLIINAIAAANAEARGDLPTGEEDTRSDRQRRLDELDEELADSLTFGDQFQAGLLAFLRLGSEKGRELSFEDAQRFAILGNFGEGSNAELSEQAQRLVEEILALTAEEGAAQEEAIIAGSRFDDLFQTLLPNRV
jgi:TP901 family phage tail tape measure protein